MPAATSLARRSLLDAGGRRTVPATRPAWLLLAGYFPAASHRLSSPVPIAVVALGLEVAFPRQRCHSLELSPLPGLSLRISPRRRRGLIPCGTSFWLAEYLLSCWGSSLRRLPRAFPPCHETHSTLFDPLVTNRKLAASSMPSPAPTALQDPHHRQAALTCRASAGPTRRQSDCNRPAASSNPCAR